MINKPKKEYNSLRKRRTNQFYHIVTLLWKTDRLALVPNDNVTQLIYKPDGKGEVLLWKIKDTLTYKTRDFIWKHCEKIMYRFYRNNIDVSDIIITLDNKQKDFIINNLDLDEEMYKIYSAKLITEWHLVKSNQSDCKDYPWLLYVDTLEADALTDSFADEVFKNEE
jgi:hypothetical protein